MPIAVKWFSSDMRGAPTVSGTAGAMIGLLDACLITGFGVTTVTGITVSGGVATATVSSGNSFDQHAVVLIEGATPAELNGEARVLTTSSTSFTFATTAPDGAASGSITAKYAPIGGWNKVFTGANKAVYRSADVTSPRHYLRVDDTGTLTARVRGFESMTGVDTGTGPFPTNAQMSGGGYWHKSNTASAAAVRWKMFGDSQMVLLAVAAGSTSAANKAAPLRGFGFPNVLRPAGDNWATLLSASGFYLTGQAGQLDCGGTIAGTLTCPKVWQGIGGSATLRALALTGGDSVSGANNLMGAFPSEIDGEMKLSRVTVFETDINRPPRMMVPGVLHIPQIGVTNYINDGDVMAAAGSLAGRQLLMVATGTNMGAVPTGIYAVDITGPWR